MARYKRNKKKIKHPTMKQLRPGYKGHSPAGKRYIRNRQAKKELESAYFTMIKNTRNASADEILRRLKGK